MSAPQQEEAKVCIEELNQGPSEAESFATEVPSKVSGSEAIVDDLNAMTLTTEDEDIFTAIYNETGIEIVSRVQESGETKEKDETKIANLSEAVEIHQDERIAKHEDLCKSTDPQEQIIPNSASDTSENKTDRLYSEKEVKTSLATDDKVNLALRQDDKDNRTEQDAIVSEKELLHRSDSKETPSPFVFPAPLPPLDPKTVTPTPKNPLSALLDPSPKRIPSKANSQDPKRLPTLTQRLPYKSRSQNQSTESLHTSRIPRANAHLGRSVSMVTPRVSSPVPLKGDKTTTKQPPQKIPHLIRAQMRPGGLLKRSVSVQVLKKKATEMAEGMTLVLAVPVVHNSQSALRSSGERSQPFIISPYQEEHVLTATCPISGITRHIKFIL